MKKIPIIIALFFLGCATMARNHCLGIYCAGYDEANLKDCRYIDDVVIICTEERVAYYRSVVGWMGAAFDGIMHLALKVL